MSLHSDVPVYKLYGELEEWLTPDMVHCETISARSQLHNWQIKPHQHHGLFQILHLQTGSAKIRLDDQHHEMRAGQILLVPQMCIHGFRFARNAEGHVVTVAYPLMNKLGRAIGDGLPSLTTPHLYHLNDDPESIHLRMSFGALDHEYKRNAPHRDMLLESLLVTILIWLTRNSSRMKTVEQKEARRGAEHFSNFCRLIEDGFSKQHPVACYAEKIGITPAHLNVLCRQAIARSALQMIHDRMLLEAKRNLVYTSMSVSLVSYALGFSDPAYFTRFFKRQAGVSPKEFRLQAKTLLERENI